MTGSSPNFDRVARWYLPAERLTLGWWLERTREFFLPDVAGAREAVLFGDGDGRFAARLLATSPDLHATAVDGSAAMLRLLQRRCERAVGASVPSRLRCVHQDGRLWQPTSPPDLLVTHFFLDCLSTGEVQGLANRLAQVAQPGCLWLVSDFAAPQRQPWRSLGAAYIGALYRAFGVLTGLRVRQLPAMRSALAAAGFQEIRRREFLGGLLFTSLWKLAGHPTPTGALPIHTGVSDDPTTRPASAAEEYREPAIEDPLPDPEPPVPSLPRPDAGVFDAEA